MTPTTSGAESSAWVFCGILAILSSLIAYLIARFMPENFPDAPDWWYLRFSRGKRDIQNWPSFRARELMRYTFRNYWYLGILVGIAMILYGLFLAP